MLKLPHLRLPSRRSTGWRSHNMSPGCMSKGSILFLYQRHNPPSWGEEAFFFFIGCEIFERILFWWRTRAMCFSRRDKSDRKLRITYVLVACRALTQVLNDFHDETLENFTKTQAELKLPYVHCLTVDGRNILYLLYVHALLFYSR